MGLFDGVRRRRPHRRLADVAALLGLPVLLVLDVSGQAQSAAARRQGLRELRSARPRSPAWCSTASAASATARLAGERSRRSACRSSARCRATSDSRCRSAISAWCRPSETAGLDARLDALADFVASPRRSRRASLRARRAAGGGAGGARSALPPPGQRIAVARDAAFSLPLSASAARLARGRARRSCSSRRSPTSRRPADCDACWLPGGYPELHAGALAGCAALPRRPAPFRRDPAGARRVRRLHGAGRALTSRRRGPRDGRPARRRDQLRQAQA